jgi:hypothetical protein
MLVVSFVVPWVDDVSVTVLAGDLNAVATPLRVVTTPTTLSLALPLSRAVIQSASAQEQAGANALHESFPRSNRDSVQ